MDIIETVKLLRGAPHLIAARPRGVVIRMNERGKLIRLDSVRENRYSPAAFDLVAIDWRIFTPQQYAEMRAAMAAAREQQAQGVSDGDG